MASLSYTTSTLYYGIVMRTMKYFTAAWCGPCQRFKPIMQELAAEGYHVATLDIDIHKDLAEQYNIRSVPTIVIEDKIDGEEVEVDRIIGTRTKEEIIELL